MHRRPTLDSGITGGNPSYMKLYMESGMFRYTQGHWVACDEAVAFMAKEERQAGWTYDDYAEFNNSTTYASNRYNRHDCTPVKCSVFPVYSTIPHNTREANKNRQISECSGYSGYPGRVVGIVTIIRVGS